MALVVPQDGTLFVAELLRRGLALQPIAGLFTNDLHPGKDTVLADLIEASFLGYTRLTLGAWSPAIGRPDGTALLVAPQATWTSSAAPPVQRVLGYFLVQLDWTLATRLICVERVGKGVTFGIAPGHLRLTIPFSVGSFF